MKIHVSVKIPSKKQSVPAVDDVLKSIVEIDKLAMSMLEKIAGTSSDSSPKHEVESVEDATEQSSEEPEENVEDATEQGAEEPKENSSSVEDHQFECLKIGVRIERRAIALYYKDVLKKNKKLCKGVYSDLNRHADELEPEYDVLRDHVRGIAEAVKELEASIRGEVEPLTKVEELKTKEDVVEWMELYFKHFKPSSNSDRSLFDEAFPSNWDDLSVDEKYDVFVSQPLVKHCISVGEILDS